MTWARDLLGWNDMTRLALEYILDIALVGLTALVVLSWRLNDDPDPMGRPNIVVRWIDWLLQWPCKMLTFLPTFRRGMKRVTARVVYWLRDGHISMEAAILLLIGMVFVASSHVFPWYTTVLLPWIAVLLCPIWTRARGWDGAALAVAVAWYFSCFSVLHYFMDHGWDWNIYYITVYDVVVAGICAAILLKRWQKRQQRRSQQIYQVQGDDL
jgi:hypothetical protein